jgi:hypothetical protein
MLFGFCQNNAAKVPGLPSFGNTEISAWARPKFFIACYLILGTSFAMLAGDLDSQFFKKPIFAPVFTP